MTNREFSKTDKRFVEACESAEVKPTVRQASKWRRKKGKAWKCLEVQNGKVKLNRSQSKGY